MRSKILIYILSPIAIVLGVIYLVSTISAPSPDTVTYLRDLATSLLAITLGAAAPVIMKKFTSV